MKNSLSIIFVEDSLSQSSLGQITGVLYWKIDGVSFPDENWSDSVVVIMDWWIKAVIRILDGQTSREIMSFMDGPFEVVCERRDEFVECKFLEKRGRSVVCATWTGNLMKLVKNLFIVAKCIDRSCYERTMENSDRNQLRDSINLLRKKLST